MEASVGRTYNLDPKREEQTKMMNEKGTETDDLLSEWGSMIGNPALSFTLNKASLQSLLTINFQLIVPSNLFFTSRTSFISTKIKFLLLNQ